MSMCGSSRSISPLLVLESGDEVESGDEEDDNMQCMYNRFRYLLLS